MVHKEGYRMEPIRKVGTLLVATAIVWLTVLAVGRIENSAFVSGVGAIVALIATMTMWSMWALNEYGISMDGQPREKAKRDVSHDDDPRLALLLSLFTPDERDALRSRLMEDLETDGENPSLADLLAEHEPRDHHSGDAS
jgi:hypothetical protein